MPILSLTYDARMYKATPDGTTNAAAGINAAAAAAALTGGTVVVEGGTFKITAGLVLPAGAHLRLAEGARILVGTGVAIALTVGETSGTTSISYTQIENLALERETIGWAGASPTDSTSIGLLLRNTRTCDIDITEIRGFTVGVRLLGDGNGCVYNNIDLGAIVENKVGLDFTALNAGWSNENNVWGGRIRVSTAFHNGSNLPVTGSCYVRCAGNNNRLWGVALEENYVERSLLFTDPARNNAAHHCRFEGAAPIEFAVGANFNVIQFGYGVYGHNAHRVSLASDDVKIIDNGLRNIVNGGYGHMSYANNQRGGRAAYSAQASGLDTVLTFEGRNMAGDATFSVNGAGVIELAETAAPDAPTADRARLFTRDNGSGKTQVCIRFATGAIQVLATEP